RPAPPTRKTLTMAGKPRCGHRDSAGEDACQGFACFDWPVCRTHLKWYARKNLWPMVHARAVAEVSVTKPSELDVGCDYDLWFLSSPTATEVERFERKDTRGHRVYLGRRKNAVRCPVDIATATVVADYYESQGDHES